jgi:hypothetical protein
MGGVDLFDRLLSSYRPMLRRKKRWWPLLMNVLNAAVVAGWHLHCQVLGAKALSHLEFRRQVTLTLIRVQTTTALSLVVVHRALCQSQFSLKELVTFLHRVDTDAVVFVKKKKKYPRNVHQVQGPSAYGSGQTLLRTVPRAAKRHLIHEKLTCLMWNSSSNV